MRALGGLGLANRGGIPPPGSRMAVTLGVCDQTELGFLACRREPVTILALGESQGHACRDPPQSFICASRWRGLGLGVPFLSCFFEAAHRSGDDDWSRASPRKHRFLLAFPQSLLPPPRFGKERGLHSFFYSKIPQKSCPGRQLLGGCRGRGTWRATRTSMTATTIAAGPAAGPAAVARLAVPRREKPVGNTRWTSSRSRRPCQPCRGANLGSPRSSSWTRRPRRGRGARGASGCLPCGTRPRSPPALRQAFSQGGHTGRSRAATWAMQAPAGVRRGRRGARTVVSAPDHLRTATSSRA